MNKDTAKLLKKKKQDKTILTWFSVIAGVIAAVLLITGLILDVNAYAAADGILALFAVVLLFCLMGVIIICFIKREIRFLEHPELKTAHDTKAKSKMRNYSKSTRDITNPYTDEVEEDDALSIEEIDHLESDIFDDV